jgi:N-acetylglutamate synthase-like GNAT family acetyltransferase
VAKTHENEPIHIQHLIDVQAFTPTLERWYIDEWAPWYGAEGKGDAHADLVLCNSRVKLPICLIALSSSGELLGTAALKNESIGSELGMGPWLAALLVGKQHRRSGVGTALVKAIEKQAERLGLERIYCTTDTASNLLERCGWRTLKGIKVESLRGTLKIYCLEISKK